MLGFLKPPPSSLDKSLNPPDQKTQLIEGMKTINVTVIKDYPSSHCPSSHGQVDQIVGKTSKGEFCVQATNGYIYIYSPEEMKRIYGYSEKPDKKTVTMLISVDITTSKSVDEISKALKRGIIRGLDTSPYIIAAPSDVKINFCQEK
jgi:hypothetical protein